MTPLLPLATTALLSQLAVVSTKMDSSLFAVANLDTLLKLKAKFAISVILELTGIHSSLNVLPAQASPLAAHTRLMEP